MMRDEVCDVQVVADAAGNVWQQLVPHACCTQCNTTACNYDNWACMKVQTSGATATSSTEPLDPGVFALHSRVPSSLNAAHFQGCQPVVSQRSHVFVSDEPPESVASAVAAGDCVWIPPLHMCLPTRRVLPMPPSLHGDDATADEISDALAVVLASYLSGFSASDEPARTAPKLGGIGGVVKPGGRNGSEPALTTGTGTSPLADDSAVLRTLHSLAADVCAWLAMLSVCGVVAGCVLRVATWISGVSPSPR